MSWLWQSKARVDADEAPSFPAPGSIQRASSSREGRALAPTPGAPSLIVSAEDEEEAEDDDDDDDKHVVARLPTPSSSDLQVPLTQAIPPKPRKKVRLEPGYSQLDWARLKASGANLRGPGVDQLRRISRGELALHRTKDDAWSAFGGKVYNISPYLRYHPGGVQQLMRVAGTDGTELFMKTHSWISVDAMLDQCLVGFLV